MDAILEKLTDFAYESRFEVLPSEAVNAAKERIVDALGCAIGAWGCGNAEAGLRVATVSADEHWSGNVLHSGQVISLESSTFVNGCLIRELDFNDTYPGGHPSDGLAAPLSVASTNPASGRALINAAVVSYEIFIRLQRAGKLREKGWDNGFGIGVGVAGAMSGLLGLTRDQTRHALALVATANVPLRASRAGMLSSWKGGATAFSTRAAVTATLLAAADVTGPEAPFTGRHGLLEQVTGDLILEDFGDRYFIPRAKIKYWPVVYNLQALVWAGLDLRDRVNGREVRSIQVRTYWSAWHESGSETAKWNPTTKETADHSLPYILAWTLRHGPVSEKTFAPEQYTDPDLKPLMDRITVVVDDVIEAAFPEDTLMHVIAEDDSGQVHEVHIENPLGHEKNPVSRQGIDEKFTGLTSARLGADGAKQALERWWAIDDHDVASSLLLLAGG